jgi:hypothetical protein
MFSLAFLAAALISQAPASGGGPPPPAAKANGAVAAPPARRAPRMASTAQRNENVIVYQIDTNAVKELNIRVGATPTAVREPAVESQYFATEHGQPASEQLALRPVARPQAWRGETFWSHQNSVFNARTFFQVGGVKPSHRNHFGGRLTGLVPKLGALTASFAQRDVRGMVNGNVLVPLAHERTPLTADPALRPIIQRFLNAYPNELPNRPDFDIRALNTNSPQRIDDIDGSLRLERQTGTNSRLILSHAIVRQRILAFQFVAGQNPNTEIHTQRSRLTWIRALSPATEIVLAAAFDHNRSALLPEPNAVGPRVRFGFQIEELGPDSMFPVNRATTTFRYGAAIAHQAAGGKHQIFAGADVVRFRVNGIESSNMRGYFQFTNNFGRQAIENLRLGTPSIYEVTIGDLWRGYRNWSADGYIADRWRPNQRLQVYYGLRWTMDTRPVEIRNQESLPYRTDWNNFSPRFSLAWRAGRGWTARAMYATSFMPIPPVTYQQVRNNLPGVFYVQVPDPDLANPLHGIDLSRKDGRNSPTWFSPDLVSPYSHQYNAGIERQVFAGAILRFSYIGSRTIKLLNSYVMNRAEPVPGIPLTSATVDQRRPDPRYYETRTVLNGGIAWFDGGQATLDLPARRGFAGGVTYAFAKALDQGPDFSGTAANKDLLSQRSQHQYDSLADRKGLSTFDSPHSLAFYYTYELPRLNGGPAPLRLVAGGWQFSGVNMWKRGTPLTLYIGSDAPGFGNVDGGPSDRPHIVDPSILGATIANPDVAPLILRRERFAFIRPGEPRGNLGRNTFRKAPIWNWNAALARQWRVAREQTIQFRAEAINLSNTPQFDEPQRNLSAQSFGKITNTLNDGRVFQLGLRYVF